MIDRFFAFLEHMRTQPEHTRRTFALSVSAGITLLLLIIWGVFVLPRSISNASNAQKTSATNVLDVPAPDQSAKESTGNTQADWATSWNELQAKYGSSANANANVNGAPNQNAASSSDTTGADTVTPKNYNPDLPVLPDTPSYPSY